MPFTGYSCSASCEVDLDGFILVLVAKKGWLSHGIEELGLDVAAEVEAKWMVPLLVEVERDRLIAWYLGESS